MSHTIRKLRVTVDGQSYDVEVELLDSNGEEQTITPRKRAASSISPAKEKKAAPSTVPKKTLGPVSGNDVISPLSAVVITLNVKVGDAVKEGQTLITLEAMKMNTLVSATSAGTVKEIKVKEGDAVEEGQPLLTVE
jgi:biotin carboxyl carrier protein